LKTLILVRHAKSDWGDPSLSDIDRPLNQRGKKDAPEMAKRLKERNLGLDAFITSPAKRARKTAQVFFKEFELKKERFIEEPGLYGASEAEFYEVIKNVKDKFDCIALFSHNPGLTDFANRLTETRIDNIPTSGIFAVKADCKNWSEFREAKKEFLFFDYPKLTA
jgi:phosphohistidine phosphatase